MNNSFEISKLISKSAVEKLTNKELVFLETWLRKDKSHIELYKKVCSKKSIYQKKDILLHTNKNQIWQNVNTHINKRKRVKFISTIMRYAAVILIPISIFTFLIIQDNVDKTNDVLTQTTENVKLILSDGTDVNLGDKENIQSLSKNVNLEKNQLTYSKKQTSRKIKYNTLIVPKGEKFNLQLADGTKVVMNSDSRLKYPTSFIGKNRKVFLEGEAYFDVAKDQTKPFIINSNKLNIRVLGTSFNVRSYKNEPCIKTTLVEGSVKVYTENNKNKSITLKPSEQSTFSKEFKHISVKKVNTDIYTAWIKNRLVFENERLDNIINSLSRAYNLNVIFVDNDVKEYHFSGDIKLYKNINKVVELLEVTKKVKLNVVEDTIYISKK